MFRSLNSGITGAQLVGMLVAVSPYHMRQVSNEGSNSMIPAFILWLLGVPLGLIILLWLFGVFG